MRRLLDPRIVPSAPPSELARRGFLQLGLAGISVVLTKSVVTGCGSDDAGGGGGSGGAPPKLVSNLAAIGPLGDPDANGLRLPAGFTSRIVARTGEKPAAGSDYAWHGSPDGGATFPTSGGGWIYVSNSELPFVGGTAALRFDADGNVIDAYAILSDTNLNCAGGKTPWGTWLSCEEAAKGRVFECDPTGKDAAILRSALGVFKHEGAAYEPQSHALYMTEDEGDGRFYRFLPAVPGDDGTELEAGTLQAAEMKSDGSVTWHDVPDPTYTGNVPTRQQVAASTAFDGGEGIWHHAGVIYFSTKGDNRVWAHDVAKQRVDVLYDADTAADPILTGVDTITGTCCGDLLVAEDGGDMQVVAILADGSLKPLAQIVGHDGSEVSGLAFDPSGTRLYFNSQRAPGGGGWTYEVTGPFHLPAP